MNAPPSSSVSTGPRAAPGPRVEYPDRLLRRLRARPLLLAACGLAAWLASAGSALAVPPPSAGSPVPDPGKAIASDDDASAIAVNPANLAFLPAPELRWNWVSSATAPLPQEGHSFSVGLPLWALATGLRVDLLSPPDSAGAPFAGNHYHWVRWDLAMRGGEKVAFGTTFGWAGSNDPALDGYFSVTSALTLRPWPWLSLAGVARNWNEPSIHAQAAPLGCSTTSTNCIERSVDWGLAVRPTSRRDLELGLETAYYTRSEQWAPRATLGLDVPRVGRLRGDVTVFANGTPGYVAMGGLDLNLGFLQLSGGAVGFAGKGFPSGSAGFYAGAAIRAYREPGARLPSRVAKVVIKSTPGVRAHTHLLQKLWRLAEDPEVTGVVLVMKAEPAGSLAHAEELADAVRTLRAHHKKVLCHLEDAGGKSLFVCSQADRITMNPAGGLRFAGLSASYFYLGGLLEKLGVKADFVRIGAHKLAAEELTRSGGSAVAKSDHQELVDQFASIVLHDVGGGRRIAVDELRRRLATGPFLASEARSAGLIDSLSYEDEINRVVEQMMDGPARVVDYEPVPRAPERFGEPGKVAVIYLSGDMVDGESQSIPFLGVKLAGSATIVKALKHAREDSDVKAVVFRIETGGGSSLAADVILREAQLTAKAKPLIVSMGGAAASGGYYAAMAGREIFADRATITGSIGIFYGKVDVSGLLAKIGVHVESYRSSPRADAESLFRPFTDDERRELGVKVKQFYDLFIARVAEGRHLAPETIDSVARGKVWTGQQALSNGLVDKLGGLREALARARELGHLPDDASFVEGPEEDESLLGFVLNLAGAQAAGLSPALGALVPPGMLQVARALAPFLVYEPTRPLAHAEVAEDGSFGGATGDREE